MRFKLILLLAILLGFPQLASSQNLSNILKNVQGTMPLGFVIPAPVDADSYKFWKAPVALTVTDIDCIVGAATSADIDIMQCSSTGTGCVTIDAAITCTTTGAADDGALSNAVIAAGDWLLIDVGTVTGTPGYVSVTITSTVNE